MMEDGRGKSWKTLESAIPVRYLLPFPAHGREV